MRQVYLFRTRIYVTYILLSVNVFLLKIFVLFFPIKVRRNASIVNTVLFNEETRRGPNILYYFGFWDVISCVRYTRVPE